MLSHIQYLELQGIMLRQTLGNDALVKNTLSHTQMSGPGRAKNTSKQGRNLKEKCYGTPWNNFAGESVAKNRPMASLPNDLIVWAETNFVMHTESP